VDSVSYRRIEKGVNVSVERLIKRRPVIVPGTGRPVAGPGQFLSVAGIAENGRFLFMISSLRESQTLNDKAGRRNWNVATAAGAVLRAFTQVRGRRTRRPKTALRLKAVRASESSVGCFSLPVTSCNRIDSICPCVSELDKSL
jgi:hypothetical protein